MGYNFVIQPFHDFRKWEIEGYRTRDAHFFEELEKRKDVDRIVVINRPLSLAEKIVRGDSIKDVGTFILKNKSFSIRKMSEKTYIFDFYTWDFAKVLVEKKKWWDSIFRSKKISDKIKYGLKYLNISDYILLIQNPMAIGLAGDLDYKILVFDVIDNWLEHTQMKPFIATIQKNYNEAEEKADLIISVSKSNRNIFRNRSDLNFVEITNGVDLNKFVVGNSIKFNMKKPVIGYVGKIQERFDLNLLAKLAESNLDYTFMIYGPLLSLKKESKEIEERCNNIHFLGEVSYDRLPLIINTFDIGIIPHRITKFTSSMNPLKLYEYLSCGTPVVTTKVNGVDGISKFVTICENEADFFIGLQESIKNLDCITRVEVHDSLSDSFSWKNKTQQLINEINKYV